VNLRQSYGSLIFPLLFVSSLPCRADILVVNAEGTGQYPNIRAAVEAAVDGDEIHLVAGTYMGLDNQDISYHGKAITIRSQSGNHDDVEIMPNGTAFIFENGEGQDSRLEAITIRLAEQAVRIRLASPTIKDCLFIAIINGAIDSLYGSPTIESCGFLEGISTLGPAAIRATNNGKPLIVDCYFSQNQNIGGLGGSILIESGTVRGCSISSSYAREGGGIAISGFATIEDCSIQGESADIGGGIEILGGYGLIRRCEVRGTSGTTGGAIAALFGDPSIENCQLTGTAALYGDAIYFGGNRLTVANTIIINCGGTCLGCGPVHLRSGSKIDVRCSDVFGNDSGNWVGALDGLLGEGGNIEADPIFCDPDNGNYHLYSNSPCAPGNSNSDGCGLIGAYGVGCGPSSVEAKSWGRIKGMYR